MHKLGGQRRASSADADLEDDLDGFIDDDLTGEDWRLELQQVTGYDPKKCAYNSEPTNIAVAELKTLHFPLPVCLPHHFLGRNWFPVLVRVDRVDRAVSEMVITAAPGSNA